MTLEYGLLENIFIQSIDAIAITNTDFENLKFKYVNPAFLNLTGYPKDEIINSSPKILQGKETNKAELKRLKKLCLEGKIFKGENINYKKDGTPYWVEWTISPIKDKDENIINYLSMQRDISKEKELEKKLLENIKINTLHSLSAGLTHELNTSLTTIKGSLEIMELDLKSVESDNIKQNMQIELDTLNKSTSTIANITNSLHYLTNSEVKIEKQENIFELLDESLSMYKTDLLKYSTCTINGHNAFDEKSKHFKEYYADIHKNSIKHVFMIIIDNAVDELKKVDDKKHSLFDVNITQTKDLMSIDFTDNAGGIKNKNLAKIFNALYKDKDSYGLGMGLNVAKNIMIDNGGDIEAFSNPPKTIIRVTIPL